VGRTVLEGMIRVSIDYSVIITNTRHNMVFPFYYTEGTNLPAAYKPGRVLYDE
jgi:hypothetical protein